MNRNSIVQEYVTLATNEKGNLLSYYGLIGVVVSSITDLRLNGIVALENKKLEIKKNLPDELHYLVSLYEYLLEKPRTMNKVMEDYFMGMTDKRAKRLMADIGEALIADGFAVKGSGGIFGKKEVYTPVREYKESLIAAVKAEIMQKEEWSVHDTSLVCILQRTDSFKQYISKYENKMLKAKWKAMKKDPKNKEVRDMMNYVDDTVAVMTACIITIS